MEVYHLDEAKVDSGISRSEKEDARNKRAGITNNPYIGNKWGQNFHRQDVHMDSRGEKKVRGEKEDNWWKTKFIKDKKTGKLTKYRHWHASNEIDKRARIEKEEVDLYDIILSHLLDEGYAETPEAAEVIMVNMSEEWRNSIVE
jgi:hypothetical protein